MNSTKPALDGLRIERNPEHKPSSRMGWIVAVIIILFLIGAGLGWRARSGAVEVQTTTARGGASEGGAGIVLNASGYVTARREATVSSKVTGKVTEVLIEEGLKVKAGQILARLDDTNIRTSLEVAQAQYNSSKSAVDETVAQLKLAQQEFQRTTNLASQKIASQSDLDKAESEAKSLAARLARQERDITVAERQVALWQQQLDDMVIRAPFDGVVTTKDAQPGEMISPVSAGGGFTRTGIGTIVDMNSLEIEIDVNESYINRVEPGQAVEATLDAYPEWKIPCKVIAIVPTADRQKSTVKVRVSLDQLDPRILPEMAVKVAFRDAGGVTANRMVIIPKNALCNRDGRDVVFVFQNGRAERRAVSVSQAQGDEAVVSAGLSAGEKIILNTPPDFRDGTSVKEKNP